MPKEQTIIVLGASGFVGTAVATRLARDYRVVGTRFRTDGTAPIEWIQVDLRDPAALVAALESLDNVTALVHCAGVGEWLDLGEVGLPEWDDAMAVTARSFLVAAKWFAAHRADGGRMVAVTGMPGVTNVPAPAHIAASNAALTGLVHSLAGELGERDISVTAVMLGPLDGGLSSEIPEGIRSDYERFSSLRRCATADEAAEIVAFCLSAPRSLTGAILKANGGL